MIDHDLWLYDPDWVEEADEADADNDQDDWYDHPSLMASERSPSLFR